MAELSDLGRVQPDTRGLAMPAEAGEEILHGIERVQKMEGRNAATRTAGGLILFTEYKDGAAEAIPGLATMPTTPRCHPGLEKTKAKS